MRGDGAVVLQRTAVGEVIGDARCAKTVAVHRGRQTRRRTIWGAICLFMHVPFKRDLVMSRLWNSGAFGVSQRPVASMYSPRCSTSLWRAGTWCSLPPFSWSRNMSWWLETR